MSQSARVLVGVVICLAAAASAWGDLQPLNDEARENAYIVYRVPDSAERVVFARNVTGGHFAGRMWLKDGKQAIVVDGVQQDSYDEVTMPFVGDYGARIAYIADKTKLVVDGKVAAEHKEFGLDSGQAVVFSADGGHMAYCASDGDGWFVSKDGEKSESYKRVWWPAMPADGSRLAFCAEDESGRCLVILDGEPGSRAFDDVTGPAFSDDGKQFVYAAKTGGEWYIVRDGVEGAEKYAGLKEFTFSDDGKRFAYAAKLSGSEFAVLDGQRQKGYNEVAGLVFSPDGSRFGYAARTDLKWLSVVDGQEGIRTYEAVTGITFMPDAREYVYMSTRMQSSTLVVRTSEQVWFSWASDPISTPGGTKIFYISAVGRQYDRADRSQGFKPATHVYQTVMGVGRAPGK